MHNGVGELVFFFMLTHIFAVSVFFEMQDKANNLKKRKSLMEGSLKKGWLMRINCPEVPCFDRVGCSMISESHTSHIVEK